FADIKRLRVGGLLIGGGSVFLRGLNKLAALTVRHAVPAIAQWRSFPAAGGLMSYGSDFLDSYRMAGVYTGRVLKGENPAELPVVQATKFEWSSISKPPRRSALACLRRCKRARTR